MRCREAVGYRVTVWRDGRCGRDWRADCVRIAELSSAAPGQSDNPCWVGAFTILID